MQKDKTEKVQEKVYYQWIKGEKSGDVVTIKDTDDKWINFNEGGRLAKDLQDEFIQLLDEDIAGEFVNPTSTETDPLNVSAAQKLPTEVSIPALDATPNPIRVLFDKQKKNNKVKLLLEFPVNIPQKAVYELMSTSFDRNEVNDVLQSFINDQLSEDEILDCLYNSIQSLVIYNKINHMSETANQTIPNRRQRRAAMKHQGILKMKSKLSLKDWLEVCKKTREKGNEIHTANLENADQALSAKLEELESIKMSQWKEEGYTDKEIEQLREVFAMTMVKDKSTWHTDKKVARKTLKELRLKLQERS